MPVRRLVAPSSLLRNEAGTTMVATVPPPRPETTLANPRRPELAVPVELLVGRELDTGDVHDDADERDERQGQQVGELGGHRAPFHLGEIGGPHGRPEATVRCARQEEGRRSRLFAGHVQGDEDEVVCANREHDAHRQNQGFLQRRIAR